MPLSPGTRLGSYEILSPLGAGGMGEVYRARHVKLGRDAAVKVLPTELASEPERLRRFEREARAASALNHPVIVTIYDIDEHEGTSYIAMELVEGQTLRERLADGPLETKEALRLAIAIAEGLARAHESGIVHRDLKPDNVMITRGGHAKILDFGLAKQAPTEADARSNLTTMSRETQQGMVLGTVPYMSPEQAAGRAVDHLSDQFSFGVVLYEMLCGQRPFQGDSVATVLSAILRDTPPPPRSLRPEIPRGVEELVRRCLEKDREKRFASTEELGEALRRCEESLGARRGLTLRWPLVAAALALVAVAGGAAAWYGLRSDVVRWMERDTLAEIDRLTETGELYEAFRLTREVQGKIPDDPEVRKLLERITFPISIVTEPAGAQVHVKGYSTPDAPWELLGATPLPAVRIPYALMRWRIKKEGFEPFEGAPFGERPFVAFGSGFPLDPVGSRPAGMVRVPGGPFKKLDFPAVELGDYWLDQHEVTNRQFKAFVDAGGYEREELWTESFVEKGRELPRDEAMTRFRDRTDRRGPATWELGSYDEGRADHPVGGVSWYEAAAYCRFADKSLPTIYHWFAATAQDQLSDILVLSNFGGEGPVPVGSLPGLGDFGTYDMAGNVKEWCWNASTAGRYILGSSWAEPSYLFVGPDIQPPFARHPSHGFRCAHLSGPPEEALLRTVDPGFHVVGEEEPVADDIFAAYRRMYAYDRTDLEAETDSVDETSPHWRKETVSFRAAYGGERVTAHLFLPRNASPPYQPVVWYPGDDALFLPPGEALASPYLFDFIPRSGRALVYPVYKGMYERHVPFSFAPNEWRDMMVMWSKDLGRTIDYLEERPDMDTGKLGYYGFSGGALYGPIFTAIDPRFRASVLLAGGLLTEVPPEMAGVSFAPRSRVPTLMINGRDDFVLPYELLQEPLFRLLAAPEGQKRHARLEGGHIPPDRLAIIEEVVGWFDRHLGPVATPASAPPGD